MFHKSRWTTETAFRFYSGRATGAPDQWLHRFNWDGWTTAEVDAVYSEIIGKIPAGARVLELGCGDGRFYQALKAARPSVDYTGVDLVIENIDEAQTAKGTITIQAPQIGDTVTVNGVIFAAGSSQGSGDLDFDASNTTATDFITVVGVQAGDVLTVDGVDFTASGSQGSGAFDFDETAGSDIAVASSLVAALNDSAHGFNEVFTADNAGGTSATIILTSTEWGRLGNGTPMTSSEGSRIQLRAHNGTAGSLTGGTGLEKDVALSLVAAINDPGNGLSATVEASVAPLSNVVVLRSTAPGVAGNSLTLASSTSRLEVSGSTFEGGIDPGVFEIGNAMEYLNSKTPDWDFVVSVNCLLACTPAEEAQAVLDMVNAKSPQGFLILADPVSLPPGFLASASGVLAESTNVTESYFEGARTFLTDLKGDLTPLLVVRDSTSATAPELPEQFCFIEKGRYNHLRSRLVVKQALYKGDDEPTDIKGITTSGGLVSGTETVNIKEDWKKKFRRREE